MSATSKLLGTVSGVALGGYLIAVTYNGNLPTLWETLKKEKGYLEFIVALFILGAINEFGPTSKISIAVSGIGITAVILKAASNSEVTSKISAFANGQASMLDVFKSLLGVS